MILRFRQSDVNAPGLLSPVVDLGPDRLHVVVLVDNEILVERGGRRTGMVGKNSQARAHRERFWINC